MTRDPAKTEVRAALQRVVTSHCFGRAHRAQSFLRFVTEETLAGRAGTINGYTIAIAVFGKPAGFDAAGDPLVRVEANRLRARLCEYYATVGAGDAVRIDLRPGSYVPTFRLASAAAAAATESASPTVGNSRAPTANSVSLVAGLVASAALIVGAGIWKGMTGVGSAPAPTVAPRILVQPFDAAETTEAATLAIGITEEVLTRLGSYRELQVLVRPSGGASAGADFLLSGSVSTTGGTLRVLPTLVDTRSGARLWTATFDEPLAANGVWQVVDSVAAAVAAAVGEPYGPLFDAEVARRIPGTSVDPYHCLLRFVFALQVISDGAHARATSCFEQVIVTEPESSMSWARLAALYRMEYLHGFNAKPGAPSALDRAEAAGRRALSLDRSNVFAHQELAFLCLLRDDRAGFESEVAQTLALDPPADIRAALGINFVKMGEVERGRALIDEAIVDSPRAPPFFFLGYAVDALRAHDYAAAYSWAQRMATRDWPLSQAFLAATAALAGEPERSREAAARLRDLRPAFATTGRELIARGRLGTDVETQLFRGLTLAGIPLR